MAVAKGQPAFGFTLTGIKEAQPKLAAFERSLRLMGGLSITVTSDSPYIGFVTRGTRPHRIEPRNRRALSWPGGRHPVRGVNHPGTRPNPFIPESFLARRLELERRAATEMDREFDRANPDAGRQAVQLMANVLLGEIHTREPRRTGALGKSLRVRVSRE